jgi:predicted ribosomally synthesized peptide with SipW-like signal peptide
MFNKKMFLGVLIIGVVSLLAGSATWAYFQDTEVSADNTLTAGTLDLFLDPLTAPFTLENKEPGDSAIETQTIINEGSLAGELDIAVSAITNTEGTPLEFEVAPQGDGELGGVARMALWLDLDADGVFDEGTDISLKSDGTRATDDNTDAYYYDTIDSYGGETWDAIVATMDPDDEYDLVIRWEIPLGAIVDNTIQGDSISLDITFTLEQADADNP